MGKNSRTKKTTRRKRAWVRVTFEELDAWRERRKIPKNRMAEKLGVTNSTYHNWARGIAVATPNTQERIRGIIDGVSGAPGSAASGGWVQSPEALATTGKIVRSYLETRPAGMNQEKLKKLIRDVRSALTG